MANLFVNIPAPAANGAGSPVDVSTFGRTKSIVCGGGFAATVNVEYSTDDVGAGPWAPLATFLQAGNLTIDVAAHWMRAVTSEYKSGAPNVDAGSSDAGSLFALLPADGSSVDISALPLLKTVVTPSGFAGNVEVSEDGISWAQIFSFQNGGAVTRSVVAQFARVVGGMDVWMAGANDAGAGGGAVGEAAFALLNFNWQANDGAGSIDGQKNIQEFTVVDTGVREFTFTTPIASFDIGKVIFTVSTVPIIDDAQIKPPVNVFCEATGATSFQVTAYPTQANPPNNAVDPTDSIARVYVRVDLTP